MKKIYAGIALGLVALVFVFAIGSFLRENWGADETPGALETLLANLVLWHARPAQDNIPNPFQPTEENLQAGRGLYEEQCAFCHGLDGKGQSPTGIQFYPPVPALVDIEEEMTDAQMHFIITKGIRYTAMPSFAKRFTSEEIWKIVLWVHQLSEPRPPESVEAIPELKEPRQ